MIGFRNESGESLSPALSRRPWYQNIVYAVRDSLPRWKKMDIAVIIVGEPRIRELNLSYRNSDRVTDVLSFLDDEDDSALSGELYICIGQTRKQAKRYGVSLEREMERLVIHGALHLQGYDHMKVGERKIMRGFEQKTLKVLKAKNEVC